ncbi:hypothetical protein HPB49_003189 [Dermacentor silvarum]|uniref:Uncharacterized protein n=1 Tax=Dermacentor silvarum TaxID=543639 RepID=A0ACB8DTP5_DERSI|nr:hypothetical protein HPB49_003189 [Dermacentor silvarum]
MMRRSNKTLNRIIQAYRDEGRISDTPHKRHPRATTAAQDMDILDAAQANPFSTAKEISAGAGLSPRLSEANETARLNFATEYVSWTTDDWKTPFFPTILLSQHARTKSNAKSNRAAALLSIFGALCAEIDLAFSTALKDR